MSTPVVDVPVGAPGRSLRISRAARRTAAFAVPLPVIAWLIWRTHGTPLWATDFTHSFLPAARLLWHGRSPYPSPSAALSGTAFVYPPVLALALAPFALVPTGVGSAVFVIGVFAALLGTLAALGVRDPRCYSIALLWPAVIATVQTAAISMLLALLAALAWRWRAAPARQVAAVVGAVVLKLFLWPLVVWMVAVHGWRRGAATAAAAAAVVAASWAAIGFAGLAGYMPLLRRLGAAEGPSGYTLSHLTAALGTGPGAGSVLAYAVASGLLAATWITGRRGRAAESLVLCAAAALIASPIVWLHYFVLLLVPVALASRALSAVWLLPCAALLAGPAVGPNHRPFAVAAVLVVSAATIWVVLLRLGADRSPETAEAGGPGNRSTV